ncbi:MAG: transcriptional regulator, partial [Actinotalea sp.]|nr:transcriptional regulator [Actinotalea sp.]
SEASGAQFTLCLSLGGSGGGESGLLVDLAQAILSLVSERAPHLDVRSALLLGADGPGGEDVAAPASATERAREAWRTSPADGPGLVVDITAREVVLHGRPMQLTFKEFALLEYLLRSSHRAVSRDELLETVWRGAVPADGSRTIDVHVRRLRDKLGGCLEIVTVRGVGYRCDPTPDVVLVGSGDAG